MLLRFVTSAPVLLTGGFVHAPPKRFRLAVAIRHAQDGESGAGCVRYTASPARISLDLEYQAKALDTPGRLGTF